MKKEKIVTYAFAKNLDYRCDPWIGFSLKQIDSRDGALTTNEIGLRTYSLSKISTLKSKYLKIYFQLKDLILLLVLH